MKSRLLAVAIGVGGLWLSGCTHRRTVVDNHPSVVTPPAPVQDSAPSKPAVVAERVAPKPEAPIARYPDAATRQKIDELLSRIQDAYFDYDKHFLRPDAMTVLSSD